MDKRRRKYQEVNKLRDYEFKEIEKKWQEKWSKDNIFKKNKIARKNLTRNKRQGTRGSKYQLK